MQWVKREVEVDKIIDVPVEIVREKIVDKCGGWFGNSVTGWRMEKNQLGVWGRGG